MNCHSLYFFFLLNSRIVRSLLRLATPTIGPPPNVWPGVPKPPELLDEDEEDELEVVLPGPLCVELASGELAEPEEVPPVVLESGPLVPLALPELLELAPNPLLEFAPNPEFCEDPEPFSPPPPNPEPFRLELPKAPPEVAAFMAPTEFAPAMPPPPMLLLRASPGSP